MFNTLIPSINDGKNSTFNQNLICTKLGLQKRFYTTNNTNLKNKDGIVEVVNKNPLNLQVNSNKSKINTLNHKFDFLNSYMV